jgi:hypothetical protein
VNYPLMDERLWDTLGNFSAFAEQHGGQEARQSY